jgi:hypothetical protein
MHFQIYGHADASLIKLWNNNYTILIYLTNLTDKLKFVTTIHENFSNIYQ